MHMTYVIAKHMVFKYGSLVDGCANGGVAGDNISVIFKTNHQIDIQSINKHHLNDVCIGTVGRAVNTK